MVTVSWTPGARATGHEVYRRLNGGGWEDLGYLAMPTAQYADQTVLPAGTVAEYKVLGLNAYGASADSNIAGVTIPGPPDPPANVTAVHS